MNTKYIIGLLIGIILIIGIIGSYSYKFEVNTFNSTNNNNTLTNQSLDNKSNDNKNTPPP